MTSRVGKEVYCERPYGGVGFIWRKSLCNRVKTGAVVESGRCLSAVVELDSYASQSSAASAAAARHQSLMSDVSFRHDGRHAMR